MSERHPRGVESEDDYALTVLRLSWCSDCSAEQLFERPPDDAGSDRSSEWACTVCGAAYFDGIDIVFPSRAQKRGAA